MPASTVIARPRISLEAVAIAAAVFALVQSLVMLGIATEWIWGVIIGLGAARRPFGARGHDVVFVHPIRTAPTHTRSGSLPRLPDLKLRHRRVRA